MSRKAWVLRIKPSGIDRIPEAIDNKDIIIGWSRAEGLENEELTWEEFRKIIHDTYHRGEDSYRVSGSNAGNMWRFIRAMQIDDLVVVPSSRGFHVAQVIEKTRRDKDKVDEDTAYRRRVCWLEDGKLIDRRMARSALQARMKSRQTCVEATDLLVEIEEALMRFRNLESKKPPDFGDDLRSSLIDRAHKELLGGRMNERDFEEFIKILLVSLGAVDVNVVTARRLDKGADILATLPIAGTFNLKLAVQAKYWRLDPPLGKEQVNQLVKGMEAEGADLGWLVTTGEIPEELYGYIEDTGKTIELIDGTHLATLVVEVGLKRIVPSESTA